MLDGGFASVDPGALAVGVVLGVFVVSVLLAGEHRAHFDAWSGEGTSEPELGAAGRAGRPLPELSLSDGLVEGVGVVVAGEGALVGGEGEPG